MKPQFIWIVQYDPPSIKRIPSDMLKKHRGGYTVKGSCPMAIREENIFDSFTDAQFNLVSILELDVDSRKDAMIEMQNILNMFKALKEMDFS